MQKQDCMKQIRDALIDGDVHRAVGLWQESHQLITAKEFLKCNKDSGWSNDELEEILRDQARMYDFAIYEIGNSVYYPD